MEIAELELSGLDLSLTGFSVAEIDILRGLTVDEPVPFDPVPVEAVSETGDVWLCGDSKVACGDLLVQSSLEALMAGEKADAILCDPPYNTSNATHNGGGGRFIHREFRYAHGELSSSEFVDFLSRTESAMANFDVVVDHVNGKFVLFGVTLDTTARPNQPYAMLLMQQ